MAPKTKTYSIKEVLVTISGGAEDTTVPVFSKIVTCFNKVSIDTDDSRWSMGVASTGEAYRSRNPSELGKATFTEIQLSQANDEFQDLYKLQEQYYAQGFFITVDVKDKLGQSKHKLIEGTIEKVPGSNYDKDPGDVDWVVLGTIVENEVRGNITAQG